MSHWADQYVGIPYRLGADGPQAYDCWGLVRAVLRDRFALAVPPDPVQAPRLIDRGWHETRNAIPGDLILLKAGRHPHAGVVVDALGMSVLHSTCVSGVHLTRWSDVERQFPAARIYRADTD